MSRLDYRPACNRSKQPFREILKAKRRTFSEANRQKECTYCDEQLDREEFQNPRRDEEGAVMCDQCYRDKCQDVCSRCEEIVDNTDLDTQPGCLIGIWEEVPGSGEDLQPGYYTVLRRPFLLSSMLGGGNFLSWALRRFSALDATGLRAAEDCSYPSGPLCSDCQRHVRASAWPWPIAIEQNELARRKAAKEKRWAAYA